MARGAKAVRSSQDEGDVVRLSLEGTFDAAAAWRVHDALSQLSPRSRVSLDFREVRAFHDFAIALLAQDLPAHQGRLQVGGLGQHQRRILRYFGVDEAGLGEPRAGNDQEPAARGEAADYLGL